MKHPTTAGLYQYWNMVRGTRLAPRRYEIEPSQIGPFLSETLILERPDEDACRIRIAGTQVCHWLGEDLRGELFYELWGENDQLVLQDNMRAIVNYGAVGVFKFTAPLMGTEETAEFEMLLLPLTHLGEQVERVLGSVSVLHDPDWLRMAAPTHLSLTSNEVIWPDGRPRRYIGVDKPTFLPVSSLRHDTDVRRARLVRNERRSFLVYQGGRTDQD